MIEDLMEQQAGSPFDIEAFGQITFSRLLGASPVFIDEVYSLYERVRDRFGCIACVQVFL